jgi:2-haloacid dehalogenase
MMPSHHLDMTSPTLDFGAFDALTFDCYGTLIDWETGLIAALRGALGPVTVDDETLLGAYARHEAALEAGPYLRYREVLATAVRRMAADLGTRVSDEDAATVGGSVVAWPAFPDSAEALSRLHRRFRLGVITNCDDDLFAASARRLATTFDEVVTAQQAGVYKPSTRGFELMFERLGLPRDRILHVAQSLFHDHVPAKALGLTTVWVNRRQGRPGSGATPRADATPDLTVPDMATLADLAAGG